MLLLVRRLPRPDSPRASPHPESPPSVACRSRSDVTLPRAEELAWRTHVHHGCIEYSNAVVSRGIQERCSSAPTAIATQSHCSPEATASSTRTRLPTLAIDLALACRRLPISVHDDARCRRGVRPVAGSATSGRTSCRRAAWRRRYFPILFSICQTSRFQLATSSPQFLDRVS